MQITLVKDNDEVTLEYASIASLARFLGVDRTALSRVISRDRESVEGFKLAKKQPEEPVTRGIDWARWKWFHDGV